MRIFLLAFVGGLLWAFYAIAVSTTVSIWWAFLPAVLIVFMVLSLAISASEWRASALTIKSNYDKMYDTAIYYKEAYNQLASKIEKAARANGVDVDALRKRSSSALRGTPVTSIDDLPDNLVN